MSATEALLLKPLPVGNPRPQSTPSIIRRQRLIARLHELVHRRLTMVVAPAGYGKTTLLADFVADCAASKLPISVCWYTAAAWEANGALVLRGLALALRSRFPAFGERTLLLLDGARHSPAETERLTVSAAGVLAGELEQQVQDYTLLVLDDYHLLDGDASARSTLELLLDRLPAHIHLVLLSRIVPALDTSRLILADDVGAMGPRDLAFTDDELALFLRQRYRLEPDAALVEQVQRHTEGWISGLVLAMPAPVEGPPSTRAAALLAALSQAWRGGERLHEYLALQLLRRQSEADQELLLGAALPDVCAAEEVDRVLERSDSGQALARLERAGVPLSRLDTDGGRYRMHALLRQFLTSHLEQTDRRRYEQLRRRWGESSEAREDYPAALAQYLAGRLYERAAQVLERIGERWIDSGQWPLAEAWFARLPPALVQRRRRLALVAGRLAFAQGRAALAVERARQAGFAAQRARDSVAAGRALLLEAMATVASGRAEEGQQLCLQALTQRTVRRHKPLLAEAYRTLSIVESIRGLAQPALEHMEQALTLYEQAGQTWDIALALNNMGSLHEQLGQPEQARWCHSRALALRRELGDLGGVARSLNNLGVLDLQAGDAAEAEAAFKEALALSERTATQRSQVAAHVNLGDLRRTQGRPAEALACYEAAQQAARAAVDPRWNAYAAIGEAAAHLALGDRAAAEGVARQALAAAEREGLLEVAGHARVVLAAAIAVGGRMREAGAILEAARQAVRETNSRTLQVRAYLWSAFVAYRQKRWGEALACIQVAAEAATALGGATSFTIEGSHLVPLLQMAAGRGVAVELITRALDHLDVTAAASVRESIAVAPVAPAALPPVALQLLGGFSGTVAGRRIEPALAPRSRVRELLVYLASHPAGRRREEIGADLWPEAEPGQEVTLTYTTLHRLRQALFQEVVVAEGSPPGVYRINPALSLKVDVHRFERLFRAAEHPDLRPEDRRRLLADAVAMYHGPFFPECYTDWAAALRHRLERRYVLGLARLVDLEWTAGNYRACLNWCERLLEVEQAEEAIHCRILECYDQLGEPLAGLLHYRRYTQEPGEPVRPAPRHAPLSARLAAVVRRLEAALGAVS